MHADTWSSLSRIARIRISVSSIQPSSPWSWKSLSGWISLCQSQRWQHEGSDPRDSEALDKEIQQLWSAVTTHPCIKTSIQSVSQHDCPHIDHDFNSTTDTRVQIWSWRTEQPLVYSVIPRSHCSLDQSRLVFHSRAASRCQTAQKPHCWVDELTQWRCVHL